MNLFFSDRSDFEIGNREVDLSREGIYMSLLASKSSWWKYVSVLRLCTTKRPRTTAKERYVYLDESYILYGII